MFSRALATFTILLLITMIFPPGADAQWIENGNPIVVHYISQHSAQAVSDGAGGAYLAWHDGRPNMDVAIQHIDGYGRELWTAGGIGISAVGNQSVKQLLICLVLIFGLIGLEIFRKLVSPVQV